LEKRSPLVLPTKAGYDLWAEVYDTDGNPLVLLEEPHVVRLLGDVHGLAVLDVACGTGRHTVRLAEAGAHVIGVDFSEGMLAKARDKAGASGARFIQHDVVTGLPFEDETFDRVLCCLALDHVTDLPAFFSELRRVCRSTGSVVTSVMHPAMMLKGVQARFHDSSTGREIRPQSSVHQISDYVMAALRSGLRLEEVSEHVVDASLVEQTARAERHVGWPLLLMMKLSPAAG
jgi:ubiquinone/menaquinone biosynthesis C-methylase UbiE